MQKRVWCMHSSYRILLLCILTKAMLHGLSCSSRSPILRHGILRLKALVWWATWCQACYSNPGKTYLVRSNLSFIRTAKYCCLGMLYFCIYQLHVNVCYISRIPILWRTLHAHACDHWRFLLPICLCGQLPYKWRVCKVKWAHVDVVVAST